MTWWAHLGISCKDLVLLPRKVVSDLLKVRICLSIVKSAPIINLEDSAVSPSHALLEWNTDGIEPCIKGNV